MPPLLLILVLFSDPSGQAAAQMVTEEMARIGGQQVEAVMGLEAVKRLEGMGMKEQDLVITPTMANHLTASEKNLVIIRIDRRSSGGDEILESKVWAGGKADSHVAIAGKGGDPLSGALTGIIQVIGPRLPTAPGLSPSNEDIELGELAEAKEWKMLAERLSAKPEKDPRQLYYLVMAYARLGLPEAAREVLATLRSNHASHFLTRAAETLIPAGTANAGDAQNKVAKPPVEDGNNTLRDASLPKDEDSNVLRDTPPDKDDGSNVLR